MIDGYQSPRHSVMTASVIEVECDSLAGNGQDGDITCSESERLKKRGSSRAVLLTSLIFLGGVLLPIRQSWYLGTKSPSALKDRLKTCTSFLLLALCLFLNVYARFDMGVILQTMVEITSENLMYQICQYSFIAEPLIL